MGTPLSTAIITDAETEPAIFVAVTLNVVKGMVLLGVPEITQVEGSMDKVEGRAVVPVLI